MATRKGFMSVVDPSYTGSPIAPPLAPASDSIGGSKGGENGNRINIRMAPHGGTEASSGFVKASSAAGAKTDRDTTNPPMAHLDKSATPAARTDHRPRPRHHQNSHPPSKKYQKMLIKELDPKDVVLGRGTGPNEHGGNVAFRMLILGELKRSLEGTGMDAGGKPSSSSSSTTTTTETWKTKTNNQQTKGAMAARVVELVHRRGGHFVRKLTKLEAQHYANGGVRRGGPDGDISGGGDWISADRKERRLSKTRTKLAQDMYLVVSDEVAIDKAKQSFRHQKRLLLGKRSASLDSPDVAAAAAGVVPGGTTADCGKESAPCGKGQAASGPSLSHPIRDPLRRKVPRRIQFRSLQQIKAAVALEKTKTNTGFHSLKTDHDSSPGATMPRRLLSTSELRPVQPRPSPVTPAGAVTETSAPSAPSSDGGAIQVPDFSSILASALNLMLEQQQREHDELSVAISVARRALIPMLGAGATSSRSSMGGIATPSTVHHDGGISAAVSESPAAALARLYSSLLLRTSPGGTSMMGPAAVRPNRQLPSPLMMGTMGEGAGSAYFPTSATRNEEMLTKLLGAYSHCPSAAAPSPSMSSLGMSTANTIQAQVAAAGAAARLKRQILQGLLLQLQQRPYSDAAANGNNNGIFH